MKKKFRSILSLILCLIMTQGAYAHSGRTDSSGGHKDNNNVSGLGYYHYHHGYGAHLHPNGICPYETAYPTTITGKTTHHNSTSTTDISATIDNNFIPSFNYQDRTYIIAEHLNHYGFDVAWNENDRTVQIKPNGEKAVSSAGHTNTDKTHTIEDTDIQTYIYDAETETYILVTSYNIGGQTIIPFSALGETQWNNEERCTSVTVHGNHH